MLTGSTYLAAENEALRKEIIQLRAALKAAGSAIIKYTSHQVSYQESYVVFRKALDEIRAVERL